MQHRGWIAAVGAVLLIGVGLYFLLGDDGSAATTDVPRLATDSPGSAQGSDVEIVQGSSADPGTRSARRSSNDGGVEVAHVGVRTGDPSAPGVTPTGVRVSRGLPRSDPDENRSAGWRLGQARRRVAILQERVSMYQAAVDRLVAEGNTEVAERQRAVVDRVQRRVVEFQEQETELLTEAQAEGTMGDVDQGYEEGENGSPRSAAGAGVTPR